MQYLLTILALTWPTNPICSGPYGPKADASLASLPSFFGVVPHRREPPTSPHAGCPSFWIPISGRAACAATQAAVMAAPCAPSAAVVTLLALLVAGASGARLPGRGGAVRAPLPGGGAPATAVFALGSFWRSEAAFGCLPGVIRTSVGYAGGSKANPEYRNLADHAECVKVEYDPRLIHYKQLLDVFWASHDPREVFGQGPDVGNQYRSIIFTNGTIEARLAALTKEREQAKDRSSVITTQIQPLGVFYPAEPEHQKFELKRKPLLLQLMGNLPEEELVSSTLAAKLNAYAAELCPANTQKRISSKIDEIAKKGWPILREI